MISFKTNETKVIVRVQHGIFGTEDAFETEIQQTFKYQAELLRQQFQENLNQHLSTIKEKYYQKGWKDAMKKGIKAVDRKQTDFWGGWEK